MEVKEGKPMSEFGKLFTYFFGGMLLIGVCSFAAVTTAFAGSSHGTPVWFFAYLAFTQALPIVLFFISSWFRLNSIANNTPFVTLSRTWRWSLTVYVLSFLVILALASIGLISF